MSNFSMPVHWYCSVPVHTVSRDIDLNALHHRFIKLGVSSLPVVDEDERIVGVVSRTDVVRASFHKHGEPRAPLLTMPDDVTVSGIMAQHAITIDHEDTVSVAAAMMIQHTVHRVYVTKDGGLAGVISARDVLPAVVDLRMATPVGDFMSTPLFVIAADEPLETAMSILQQARVSGVIVLGDPGPVGVFTQADALLARNLPRDTRVEDAMDTSIMTIHTATPMYMAAEQAVKSNSTRVVATDNHGARGMVTAFDFVRAAQ